MLVHWQNFSWQHWTFFFRLFTLCSVRVSASVTVLDDSSCERIGRWETCPILKIVGARLAEARVTITPALLGVSRVTVLRLCQHTWIMGRQHQCRGTSAERNTRSEKNCFVKLQN
jgi:hypothetical protein